MLIHVVLWGMIGGVVLGGILAGLAVVFELRAQRRGRHHIGRGSRDTVRLPGSPGLADIEKWTMLRRNLLDMSRSGYYVWRQRHARLDTRGRRHAA